MRMASEALVSRAMSRREPPPSARPITTITLGMEMVPVPSMVFDQVVVGAGTATGSLAGGRPAAAGDRGGAAKLDRRPRRLGSCAHGTGAVDCDTCVELYVM